MNYGDPFTQALERLGGVSTLDSPTSRRMLDMRDDLDSRRSAEEAGAREEIAQAFALMRFLPASQVAVSTVDLRHGSIRVTTVTLEEAVSELVSEGYAKTHLMTVLKESQCPLVEALRQELCSEWQRQCALDIAEARAGE